MNRKIGLILALMVAGGALAFISMSNVGDNLVYYWSPTELQEHSADAVGATIRLGGQVVPGSVNQNGTTLSFRVSDGKTEVPVSTQEIPPQMFRPGIGVVIEGTVDSSGQFQSRRMMVKHDNEYKAPQAGQQVDEEKMKKEMQQMFVDGS